jgi:hypothetical protein
MGQISGTCEYCRKSMIIGEKIMDLKRLTWSIRKFLGAGPMSSRMKANFKKSVLMMQGSPNQVTSSPIGRPVTIQNKPKS